MSEKIFADGFILKKPHEKAPDFVLGKISINVDEAIRFLLKHAENGWVNLDMKKNQQGKWYMQLNDWKPNRQEPVPF